MKRIVILFVALFLSLMNCFSFSQPTDNWKGKALKHEKFEAGFEEMDVEQTLQDLICRYEKEKNAVFEDETKEKYSDLIIAVTRVLEQYNKEEREQKKQANRAQNVIFPIPVMVAGASVLGLDLTAELILHSTMMDTSLYTPIYGGRVVGSSVTRNIAFGTQRIGTEVFSDTDTICEKDLCYSILHFTFIKPSSTSHIVTITDDYDFVAGQHDGWIEDCILSMIEARENGQMVEYPISINIDFDDVIPTNVISETGTKWVIEIQNNTSVQRTIIYNKKLCFKNDARIWENLSDIGYVELASNQTQQIEIEKNGTGDFVALSFLEGSRRFSTLLFELNVNDDMVSIESFKITRHQYGLLENIGKDGNSWLIRLKNPTTSMIFFKYNENMCHYDDARYWENLSDVSSVGLLENQTEIIRVFENGTATSIAIKTAYNNQQYLYTINELSTNCSMNVFEQIREQCTYLTLQNDAKYNNTWYIKVYNFSSTTITIYYNEKLCFNSDARTWQNLNHIRSTTISPYTYTRVAVQEYGFATTAAVSYIKDGKRIISYAYNLNTDGTMIVSETYLEV